MPDRVAFSELLREHRHAAGYSQEALAERAGLSPGAIAALEQGVRRAPYRDTVNALTGALGLSDAVRKEFERAAAGARRRHSQTESNLPVSLTSFVERGEVRELQELLRVRRLLTITGSGGVGKTRIAVEVANRAEEYYDDTHFVDLLPLHDGSMVAPHIAAGLDVPTEGADGLAGVVRHLHARHALLILDNCEHVIAEASLTIDTLLRRCPALTILATSREPLALSGELAFRLPSMDVAAGVELFATRAQSIDPTLRIDPQRRAIIADICKELDGIPLAIELAASRLSTLGFEDLLERLRSGIPLTGNRDLPPRHQTMTATIAWSYDLLGIDDRLLFQRLSVFLGGFTLAAAEEVCANETLPVGAIADSVSRLVQKSLLNLEREGTSARYRFLDSIRSYAWERLSESGEATETTRRFMKWLERKAEALDSSPSQERLIDERAELDNVAAAVIWAELASDDATIQLAARILFGFRRVWQGTNRQAELRKLAFGLLDRLRGADSAGVVGRLLFAITPHLTYFELAQHAPRVIQLLTSAGDVARAANVHARVAQTEASHGRSASATHHLGKVVELLSTPDLRRTRDGIVAIIESAYVRSLLGDFAGAKGVLTQLEIPPGESYEVEARIVLADAEFGEGHVDRAIELLEEIKPELHRYFNANVLGMMVSGNLGRFRLYNGDVLTASQDLTVALRQAVDARDQGFLSVTAEFARDAAAVAALSGRPDLAVRLLTACETTSERTGATSTDSFAHDLAMREIEAKVPYAQLAALRARATHEDLYDLIEEFLAT
ncbi:MAG TPA: helix-turn-helix domain-containing protein [Candidatus Binatia bacterium]|nr:helix-turn-helix domain-containing protein [Candidatus Binatia bacterium]